MFGGCGNALTQTRYEDGSSAVYMGESTSPSPLHWGVSGEAKHVTEK